MKVCAAIAFCATLLALVQPLAAEQYFITLTTEQGFGEIAINSSFGLWRPESATSDQLRLCHVVSDGEPQDEKENVHNTFARTTTADGTRIPVASSPMLAYPTGYKHVWDSKSPSGPVFGEKVSIWEPVCPEAFSSIGQVGSQNFSEPSVNEVVCVANKCLQPCSPGTQMWSSLKGPKGIQSGSAWSVTSSDEKVYVLGCNRFVNFNDKPPAFNSFQCLVPSCLKFSPFEKDLGSASPLEAFYPEGVHLALGVTPSSMSVAWQTLEDITKPITNSVVEWSEEKDQVGHDKSAEGDVRRFFADADRNWYTHTAEMKNLVPGARYFYRVGSKLNGHSWFSETFSFVAASPAGAKAERHVIIGDMGAKCAFSLCPACNCSSLICDDAKCSAEGLYDQVDEDLSSDTVVGSLVQAAKNADMILHVGDYGYNLDTNGGLVGDQFMRNIEQLSAYVPYMTSVGNHEDGATALAHYLERFRHMPSNSGTVKVNNVENNETVNTLFYSWNAGMVHYVAMSTEIPFGISGDGGDLQQKQYEWLEEDLKAANKNRDLVPWIVVHGHRSIYCSCGGDCDQSAQTLRDGPFFNETNQNRTFSYEDLFFSHGVDLFINGHEHNYERNYPTYRSRSDLSNIDPKATVYIVSGAAGCQELHEPFTRTQPPRSAFRSNNFGFSQMIVHNRTHLQFQQIMTDPTFFGPEEYGKIIDDVFIIQNNHGPFNPETAPKRVPLKGKETSVSMDHWATVLQKEFGAEYHMSKYNTSELIAMWRAKQGSGAWRKKEKRLKSMFEKRNGKLKWEDVRMDGSSDGAFAGDVPPELIPGMGDPRKKSNKENVLTE
jgi:acid phosphatase type 7